jgi:ABC-2 type transport system ATP-binding protein
MPAVEVRNLRKLFRARVKEPGLAASARALLRPVYRDVEAVKGISFDVEPGEMVAFIGPNGAGKSTTIKMLTGILYPSGGEAKVLGLVPWRQRQRLVRRIAAVFGQRSQLWYHLPPLDSFELLARIYELESSVYRPRLANLIERFDVEPFLRTPVRRLSLGERMRCEIVGSLLHAPEVLLLDEPTIGLDIVAKQRIREHIREINAADSTTVLLTSHDAGDVERLCQRALIIDHGVLVFDDSVTALKRSFLGTKRIELQLLEPSTPVDLPGVTTVNRADFSMTLEVDTSHQPIDAVVGHLVSNLRVADVTIADPPLEEIIAAVYAQTRVPVA